MEPLLLSPSRDESLVFRIKIRSRANDWWCWCGLCVWLNDFKTKSESVLQKIFFFITIIFCPTLSLCSFSFPACLPYCAKCLPRIQQYWMLCVRASLERFMSLFNTLFRSCRFLLIYLFQVFFSLFNQFTKFFQFFFRLGFINDIEVNVFRFSY